jgi:endonuclease YncB( thermonuclease family)
MRRIAPILLASLGFVRSAMDAGAAAREPMLAGPVPAVVERVIDGDTVRVRARIWLGQELVTGVRLRGVDAPELHAHCAAERDLARLAKAWLEAHIAGRQVWLSDISGDKYGGRVVARLATREDGDVSATLLSRGLAQPYDGGHKTSRCHP